MTHDANAIPLSFGVENTSPPAAPTHGLPHAAIRAKERYGIDLTLHDVIDLAKRCRGGEGLMETRPDGSRFHALILGERVLWLVYRPPEAGSGHKNGTVLTIMPPDVANARGRRDFRFKRRREFGR